MNSSNVTNPVDSSKSESVYASPTKTSSKANENANTSPLNPRPSTPIKIKNGFLETFYYPSGTNKAKGYTPNRTRTLPLDLYEGQAHCLVRSGTKGDILREQSYLYSPEKHNPTIWEAKLLVQLKNLTKRVNRDFVMASKQGIDPGHFHATQKKIAGCIKSINKYYESCARQSNLTENGFLMHLNEVLAQNKFYNPFIVNSVYQGAGYDINLAKSKYHEYGKPFQLGDLALQKKPFVTRRLFNSSNATSLHSCTSTLWRAPQTASHALQPIANHTSYLAGTLKK